MIALLLANPRRALRALRRPFYHHISESVIVLCSFFLHFLHSSKSDDGTVQYDTKGKTHLAL